MKIFLRRSVVAALRSILNFSGERGRRLVSEALAVGPNSLLETIEHVQCSRGNMQFYCIGDLAIWRAQTALTKEPETIEWIDTFKDGDVFWDIGANVGIYSIYAGISRKIRVMAFEPSAGNYFLLNRNIEFNKLSDQVKALCIAFTDHTCVDSLNMLTTELGGAMSSFGVAIDYEGQQFNPNFLQGMLGYSIDDFIIKFTPSFPNHIKIDVDGIEDRIIEGAKKTLADNRLRSLSVELDENRRDYVENVIRQIEGSGMSLIAKRHAPMFEEGPFSAVFNYQFKRAG